MQLAKKEEIKKDLISFLVNKLKERKISLEESVECAKYIKENFDEIDSQEELNNFMSNLQARWPIFLPFKNAIEKEAKEKEILARLKQFI